MTLGTKITRISLAILATAALAACSDSNYPAPDEGEGLKLSTRDEDHCELMQELRIETETYAFSCLIYLTLHSIYSPDARKVFTKNIALPIYTVGTSCFKYFLERLKHNMEEARYNVSIFETPFKSLPNPKRVWLGEPNSALEGVG